MTRLRLQWTHDEKDKNRWLFAGENVAELAWLERRAKFWKAVIWLPGCPAAKKYAPLDQQVADVEATVTAWFDRAIAGAAE